MARRWTVTVTALAILATAPGAMPARAYETAEAVDAANQATLHRIEAACRASYRTAALDPIRHKVRFFDRGGDQGWIDATMTRPTPAERAAIGVWIRLRHRCVARVTRFLDTQPLPDGANRDTVNWGNSFLTRGMGAVGRLIALLRRGRLTYADFAARRASLVVGIDSAYERWRRAMRIPDLDQRLHVAEKADHALRTVLAGASSAEPAAFTVVPAAPQSSSSSSQPPPATAAPVQPVESAPLAATDQSPATNPAFPDTPLRLTYPSGPPRPDDVAVIIGNADYDRLAKDIPDVTPAYDDADSMRLYAEQALGVKPANIILLKDATGARMRQVFGDRRDAHGQLYDWVHPGRSRVFVFYAGHGAPGLNGGTPYLVPVDADASRLDLTGYPLAQLYHNLAQLPARRVTVVLDACFSGMSPGGPILANASPIDLAPKSVHIPSKLTVIAAGAANQIASWGVDGRYGLFTEYFLKGMAGAADRPPWGNGNGHVSLMELKRYLDATMTYAARRDYGRDQVAQIVSHGKIVN